MPLADGTRVATPEVPSPDLVPDLLAASNVLGTDLVRRGRGRGRGPAPVRRFLPDLIDRIWNRQIASGRVFDLELPLDDAAEGYAAMDQRRAIKVLLHP